ncbi:MAG: PQQ-binding-like beta-propeller repeat protein [Draconibacterium sp.]|nr:PQQ-binding-like beta-propeller repeat protein [Draconibacterium sp.]
MRNKLKFISFFVLLCLLVSAKNWANESINLHGTISFSTEGHTVYHLQPANVEIGERAIISATYDGFVLCHRQNGELVWKTSIGGFFPFDLAVADIDGDNLDEVLVATGAGVLYAIDNTGNILWTFDQTAPLFQVCTARLSDGSVVILSGGVGKVLYTLSSNGEVLKKMQTEHVLRHIRSGNILGDGNDYVAVATTKSGLSGTLSLMLINPSTQKVLWKKNDLGGWMTNSGKRFFSMAITDLNNDAKEDILLSNSWGNNGRIYAFDDSGEMLFTSNDERIPNVPYRMNLLEPVILPDDEFVIGLFGNVLIIYNNDGSCRDVLSARYSFSNCAFDAKTNRLWFGSSVSGGDGIYAIDLNKPGWKQEFEQIRPVGKLVQIKKNLSVLKEQIKKFKAPDYQPEPRFITVFSKQPKGKEYSHINFGRGITLSQKFEKQDELWNRSIDRRRRYNKSADEIIEIVKGFDAQDNNFKIWTGHGSAIHMPLSTLKGIIEASPNRLWGFEFAEMEKTDALMKNVVEEILLPLAQQCQKSGKKIIFRNKNIFWNGSCYVPFWKHLLFESGLNDVFIPSVEETNCRTQELSLSGRLGLWLTGDFDQWSCRMVTDNANFDRMWEWGGQQVLSHHLRHLVSRASLGADVFMNDIHQGSFTNELYQQLTPFYDMVEKGIIQIPGRDKLLSVSPVAIGMKSPPSADFIKHGTNGHSYNYPEDNQDPKVFDRLDCYWAGSQIQSYDFSYYGLGVNRRMSNFLPTAPYGIVAIIPDDFDISGTRFDRKITTDGQFFYDENGNAVEAANYKSFVEKNLKKGLEELPVKVIGDAHWIVSRLDSAHVRVILIDPGYLDPSDRNVEIVLQHLRATKCTDILSGEGLTINNNKIPVEIPTGVFRILDIEHNEE